MSLTKLLSYSQRLSTAPQRVDEHRISTSTPVAVSSPSGVLTESAEQVNGVKFYFYTTNSFILPTYSYNVL